MITSKRIRLMGEVEEVADNIEKYKSTGYSLAIGDKETEGRSVVVNINGYRLYVIGITNNTIYQYNIGTVGRIDGAVYSTSFYAGKDLGTNCCSVFFRDGNHMYVSSYDSDIIIQYYLSAGWDVSTAAYIGPFSIGAQASNHRKIYFSSNGTKLFVFDSNSTRVFQYTLTTAWDITTCVYDNVNYQFSIFTSAQGLAFNTDGTMMYASGGLNVIYQYKLLVPWNVSTAIYTKKSLDLSGFDSAIRGFSFSLDMTYLYILGSSTDKVYGLKR